jgi:DNA polymerase
MLYAIGLKRETVYIANILKCRPPNNRDPKPEEVTLCEAYLNRQVALIQPKIILAVGRIAAHNLLKTDTSLAKLRQKTFQYADTQTPLIVTYHPAYLLRSPREKRKAWQDLQYAVSVFKQQS